VDGSQATALSADIGRDSPLVLPTPEAAEKFILSEEAHWQWARGGNKPWLSDMINTLNKYFGRVKKGIDEWKMHPDNPASAQDAMKALFLTYKVPMSTDPVSMALEDIRARYGDVTAATALALQMDRLGFNPAQPTPPEMWRGVAAFGAVVSNAIGKVDTFGNLDVVSAQLSALRAEAQATNEAAKRVVQAANKLFEDWITDSSAKYEEAEKSRTDRAAEFVSHAVEKISATDAAYTKQMQLQASVSYWRKQASDQLTKSHIYLKVLGGFAAVATVVAFTIAYNFLPVLASKTIAEQPSLYAIALTITVLITTIVFWAGRVLTRLYLSAHHLSNDASERVVMIETFLALTKESKLEDKDKALVLQAVFRSSADGIVKDEGAPDASLAALFARLLDRK
jgi:hypothetical protein